MQIGMGQGCVVRCGAALSLLVPLLPHSVPTVLAQTPLAPAIQPSSRPAAISGSGSSSPSGSAKTTPAAAPSTSSPLVQPLIGPGWPANTRVTPAPVSPSKGTKTTLPGTPLLRYPIIPSASGVPAQTVPTPSPNGTGAVTTPLPGTTWWKTAPGGVLPRPAPGAATTPVLPGQPPVASKRRALVLLKPTLYCRGFRNASTNQAVAALRVPLSGPDPTTVANQLSQQLSTYQQQGGNLARCVYSGYLSPSLVARRFNGESPTTAIRKSDGYRLPIYSSYQSFLAANQGLKSRFGLLASQPMIKTSTGSQKGVRLTINNALVFFVDARNQGLFVLEPADLSIQLMPRASQVQQVLIDAAKVSLQKLIDFKNLRKLKLQQSPLPNSSFRWPSVSRQRRLIASSNPAHLFFAPDLPAASAVSTQFMNGPRVSTMQDTWVAQVQPPAYCKVQNSFYPTGFCAELEAKNVQDVLQCESVFVGRDRELTLCRLLFDEIVKIQGGSPIGSPVSPPANGDPVSGLSQEEVVVDEMGSVDPVDDGSGVASAPNDFADPQQMLPEGMVPPVAPACQATTASEQFMCALLSALTTMLQQAFASQSNQ